MMMKIYSRKGARLNIKDEKICFKVGGGGGASKTPPSKISRRFWGGFVQIIIGGFFLGAIRGGCVYGRIKYIDTLCTLQKFLADLLVFKGLFEAFRFGWERDGRDGRDEWGERWEKRSAS